MNKGSISEDLIFEISWEVVNKVGGVHTVIRSKAATSTIENGNNYYLIGPYNPSSALAEVEVKEFNHNYLRDSVDSMTRCGIKVYTGKWSIPGNPNVILFDIMSGYSNIEGWRHELFEKANISIPVFDKESSDILVFGSLVAWFLGEVRRRLSLNSVIVAHFHEWMSGVGLIFCRKRSLDIALVFTTHATILGRNLSAGNCDLYNNITKFNCDEEAGKRGFYEKHCIERASANLAHVFTSVSEITGEESQHFLGRKPDIITPNGLHIPEFVALHEFQNLHIQFKEKLNEFVRGHFFGNYHIDLDKVVYLFSAGRYEFSNKGVDVLLESISRVNDLLKWSNVDTTIILFLIFQARTNNYNVESLKYQATIRQLRQATNDLQTKIGQRIFDQVVRGHLPDPSELIKIEETIQLKKFIVASRNNVSLPPIVTHNMIDDATDPILCTLRRLGLFNAPEDRVKIIFHPQFMSATNPLFPIDYEEFVRGCNLGVFPSYYEPWGYTPAECTMLGIPSITTNLSGFGQYMERHVPQSSDYGIYIVDRRKKSVDESVNQLASYIYGFARQSRRERIMQRNRCERLTDLLDWKRLSQYYTMARRMAVERTHPDKLRYFSNTFSEIRPLKLERTLSMSPRQRETSSSDDEYPHLWGTGN